MSLTNNALVFCSTWYIITWLYCNVGQPFSGVSTRVTGVRVPQISSRGGSHAKLPPPPTFLTHNNAISGFTGQSLGLPAYACKTESYAAIKLAPRMHQNLPFWAQKSKKISGEGHSHLPRPLPRWGGDTHSLDPPLGAGASFLALAMICPPTF